MQFSEQRGKKEEDSKSTGMGRWEVWNRKKRFKLPQLHCFRREWLVPC